MRGVAPFRDPLPSRGDEAVAAYREAGRRLRGDDQAVAVAEAHLRAGRARAEASDLEEPDGLQRFPAFPSSCSGAMYGVVPRIDAVELRVGVLFGEE